MEVIESSLLVIYLLMLRICVVGHPLVIGFLSLVRVVADGIGAACLLLLC